MLRSSLRYGALGLAGAALALFALARSILLEFLGARPGSSSRGAHFNCKRLYNLVIVCSATEDARTVASALRRPTATPGGRPPPDAELWTVDLELDGWPITACIWHVGADKTALGLCQLADGVLLVAASGADAKSAPVDSCAARAAAVPDLRGAGTAVVLVEVAGHGSAACFSNPGIFSDVHHQGLDPLPRFNASSFDDDEVLRDALMELLRLARLQPS